MVNKEETQQDHNGGGRERERGDGGRERTGGKELKDVARYGRKRELIGRV